jgi:adenosylmethionine-8-amino-7-oxononanoate aminotransferase
VQWRFGGGDWRGEGSIGIFARETRPPLGASSPSREPHRIVPHAFPDSPVFYRSLTRDFPMVVKGEGCWLEDESGKRYLDASGGAFVANIGHGVTEIGAAMARQASRVAYVNGTAFTNEAVEGLADRLVRRSPVFSHAYILGSGSEAVEAALKLARQYWVERGELAKHKVIALSPGYHGNTLLALSASARQHYRKYWSEWLVSVRRVAAPYAYRCNCDGDPTCISCTGWGIEEAITEEGAGTVAAVILEPVGGSSTGASVPRDEYLQQVREICDRLGVLLIADEVLCGAGRTGTWTASEQWRVVPDIMTLGKGIGGGYAPVSAVLARREVVDVIARGSGSLLHAQTFSHHAVTCAAAVATLDYIEQKALLERCRAMGSVFHHKLQVLRAHPAVGDVRGIGLLAGIEFVADRETRAPIPRARKFAEHFTQAARDAGLIVWPNVGQADGTNGDIACLAPPFIISQAEIDEIVRRFFVALESVAPV